MAWHEHRNVICSNRPGYCPGSPGSAWRTDLRCKLVIGDTDAWTGYDNPKQTSFRWEYSQ